MRHPSSSQRPAQEHVIGTTARFVRDPAAEDAKATRRCTPGASTMCNVDAEPGGAETRKNALKSSVNGQFCKKHTMCIVDAELGGA